MIDSIISMTCSLCVRRRRTVPWVTRPVTVIKPLPTLWLGLGGDDFFCLSPTRMTGPFLSGRSSFSSLFLLDDPLLTPLGANVDAPSFSFYLCAVVDAFTKALCLTASISMKDKGRMLYKQTKRIQRKGWSKWVRIYADGSMCLVYKLQASA